MRVSHGPGNLFQNGFRVHEYVVVPESQYPVPFPNQDIGPLAIRLDPLSVMAPVHFHDEPSLRATQVCDIRPNGVLATELGPLKLPVPQARPKHSFGVSLLPPKSSCPLHGAPHHRPLPNGARGQLSALSLITHLRRAPLPTVTPFTRHDWGC